MIIATLEHGAFTRVRLLFCFLIAGFAAANAWAQLPSPCAGEHEAGAFDTGHPRYHQYEVVTEVGDLEKLPGLTLEQAFALMLSDRRCAAPGAKRDTAPIEICTPFRARVGPFVRQPVVSWVDSARHQVINYTLPGHVLHPGWVTRTLFVSEANRLMVLTQSAGTGRFPRLDERMAKRVWRKVDRYVSRKLSLFAHTSS